MFSKEELNFLLITVSDSPVVDTQTAKNKAFMLGKIAELMEMPEAPEKKPAKKSPRKKVATKKT